MHSSPASTRSRTSLRALRQGAGDGQGHGRTAVDAGGADAHALTDQLEQGSQSLVEGHGALRTPGHLRAPDPRRAANLDGLQPSRACISGTGGSASEQLLPLPASRAFSLNSALRGNLPVLPIVKAHRASLAGCDQSRSGPSYEWKGSAHFRRLIRVARFATPWG
jgi:hypothetical protein